MKAILVGPCNVGKTTFVSTLMNRESRAPTYGVDTCHVDEHIILDTSGKPLYDSIVRRFYKNASLLIFMYNSIDTFATIESYVSDFKGNVVLVYYGEDEEFYELGYLYQIMYGTPCFQCSNPKHTWEQIIEYTTPKPAKHWRYCCG